MSAGIRWAERGWLPGLVVALPASRLLLNRMVRASWASLGRDQGIFQYVAWASAHGERAYRDIRDVNGPLVPLLHTILQALGGTDEHTFRVLDLLLTSVTALFAGACLAWLVPMADERRPNVVGEPSHEDAVSTTKTELAVKAIRAATLAFAAWAAVMAQYLAYGFWDTAQRESFFDWFVLGSIGAQILGSYRFHEGTKASIRAGFRWLVVAGAASSATCFGKPTYALFTMAQLAVALLDDVDRTAVPRWRTALVFGVGAVLGALPPLAWLVARGDVAAWARISFVDVPAMYRFIWPRPARAILMQAYPAACAEALVVVGSLVGLVAARRLPRRALLLAIVPVAGMVSLVLQAKGFLYHLHPVTLGTVLGEVVLVDVVWQWAGSASRRSVALAQRVCAAAVAVGLALRIYDQASAAPYPRAPSELARDESTAEGRAQLHQYDRVDFFPVALRDAANFVASRTSEDEAVQTYGMDPYFLFLARRRSATPYIYAYDLDVDAALAGGSEEGALHPTTEQAKRIERMRSEHERDMLQRLEKTPPPAIVFMDRSPLMSSSDAVDDFARHCPDAMAWILLRYVESADFDGIRVWLRHDRALTTHGFDPAGADLSHTGGP